MKRPNSRRNLDAAITRLAGSNEDFPRYRSIIANALVGQMLPSGVVKGGSSLKIRFGEEHTRATTDLDAARAIALDEFILELQESLSQGWCGFTGRVIAGNPAKPKDVPPQYVMQPFQIKLDYLGKPWCSIDLELGHNEIGDADEAEFVIPFEANRILEEMDFPPLKAVALMPLHYQIAQKLHGVSEPNSKRAHDLIDLQLIVINSELDFGKTRDTCERLFSYRKMQEWPPTIIKGEGWEQLYAAQILPEPIAQSVDVAIDWANALISKIARA